MRQTRQGFVIIFVVPIFRDRHRKAVAPSCTRLHQVAELPTLSSIPLSLSTLSASLTRQNIPLRPIHRPYRRFFHDFRRSGSSRSGSKRSGPLSVTLHPSLMCLDMLVNKMPDSGRYSTSALIANGRKTIIEALLDTNLKQLVFSSDWHSVMTNVMTYTRISQK